MNQSERFDNTTDVSNSLLKIQSKDARPIDNHDLPAIAGKRPQHRVLLAA